MVCQTIWFVKIDACLLDCMHMSTTSTLTDGRSLRYQHRRPELLAVVAEYLLDSGVGALSLRTAAEAIGVSHATLLRHFGTKDELIVAALSHIAAELTKELQLQLKDISKVPTVKALSKIWRELCRPAQR